MNLGSRLNQILQEKNLTVSQLARESGVSAQTLYAMIKRDSNKADMEIMAKLLLALDMDFMEFLEMEPVKKRVKPQKAERKASAEPEEKAEQEEAPAEYVRRREMEDYLL